MTKAMKGTMTALDSVKFRSRFVQRRSRAAAFTLVELLVVITIIAVLVSLSMGPIKNLTSNAQRLACASNMRQLGQAILLYAADNDGLLPGNNGGSVGPQSINGVPATVIDIPLVARLLASYIPDSVWVDPDPLMVKQMRNSGSGSLWIKIPDPWYGTAAYNGVVPSSTQNPLTTWPDRSQRRLITYARPSLCPLFRCGACGQDANGNYLWPHAGKINWLFLDCHIENGNPYPPRIVIP